MYTYKYQQQLTKKQWKQASSQEIEEVSKQTEGVEICYKA